MKRLQAGMGWEFQDKALTDGNRQNLMAWSVLNTGNIQQVEEDVQTNSIGITRNDEINKWLKIPEAFYLQPLMFISKHRGKKPDT